ncbi:MAG TPA: DUF3352 domain-containing protein [Candidatus Acidoferrum sp.]|nr:DUF3352 domain-containing protein [Candidatus Acidoferrum sp.]
MTDPSELTPQTPESGTGSGSTPPAGNSGSVPPTTPLTLVGGLASSPSWWSRWHRFVIGGAATVVVLAAAAGALFLVLKPTTSVDKMVPASMDVYGLAYIDPSATQKLNLMQAVHRFPDTSTDQKIDDQLDKAFKDSGLTFSGDIKPWLGSQIGFALQLPKDSSEPPVAVLVATRDDAKAQAALTKAQNGTYGKGFTWQTHTYDGVTITVATPSSKTNNPGAYAVVDHVVVIATSEDLIHQIIDTSRGRAARLIDSSDYKATFAKLPSDRLAFVYLNGQSLVTKLKSQLSDMASPGVRSLVPQGLNGQSLGDAAALQGVGVVLSARQNAIVLDVAARLDTTKLSATTKAALSSSGSADEVVAWVPTTADGFWSATGISQAIQTALDQLGSSDPSVQAATDELGLTGPDGVLRHLTGNAGLEATVDSSITPAGAVILGTDNAASMEKFFRGVLALVAQEQTKATTTTTTYRGVKITTLDLHEPFLAGGLTPSYAVVDGMGIIGSRRAEVVAVINTHKDHHSIATDPTYTAASQASLSHPSGILYLDLARLVSTLERSPLVASAGVDSKTRADLAPLKSFIVTATTSQDGLLERLIVFVQ